MRTSHVLGYLVAFRIVNALLCTTFFQPDEFFQSLEVAHRLVFGYGWQTWEWRPETALRSPLHALLFVPGYWLVKILGLEHTDAIVAIPKVIQGVIAALNDYYTGKLASKVFLDEDHATVALFCSLASFFNAGVTVRTFSNSLETTLTAAALSYWPWHRKGSYTTSFLIAGVSCIIRPTSAVIWLAVAFSVIPQGLASCRRLAINALMPILLCTCLCLTVDTWFYGHLTFTPLNFLRVNVIEQISLFYGANPWHFYVTQALPFDTLALLPFVVHGSWLLLRHSAIQPARTLVYVALATMTALSLLSHKEFRFVQPLLPILHCASAQSLLSLSASRRSEDRYTWMPLMKKPYIKLILGLDIPAACFFIMVHMKGQVTVTNYIRHLPAAEVKSLGFLMPCHSTPWQSHMHRHDLEVRDSRSGYGGYLWALTCEPPLGRDTASYLAEDERFYNDPCDFLNESFPEKVDPVFPPSTGAVPDSDTSIYSWPSHLALFDTLLGEQCGGNATIGDILRGKGYLDEKRFWNTFLHEDSRRSGDLIIFRHAEVVSISESTLATLQSFKT